MSVRNELSTKNKWWIERYRYLELKYFCRQYPIWKKAYQSLHGLSQRPNDLELFKKKGGHSDPTAKCAEAMLYYRERIELVERVAEKTDKELKKYILEGVTNGTSYDILNTRYRIPCCKDTYYDLYHKFFYLLNKERE